MNETPKEKTNNEELAVLKELKEKILKSQYKDRSELEAEIKKVLTKNNIDNKEEEEELLRLFNDSKNVNVTNKPNFSTGTNYENVIKNLEEQIRNKNFKSKQQLSEYIQNLKNNGIPNDVLPPEKITSLLALYDSLNLINKDSLDLQGYTGVDLEKQNYIVQNSSNSVLLTDTYSSEMPKEFQKYQNEVTARSDDGLANADKAYDYMRDNIKKEAYFLTLEEALNRNEISDSLKAKIRFFLSDKSINPHMFRVDIENGTIQNTETQAFYEVRENELTGQLEIHSGNTKDNSSVNKANTQELSKTNVKVKRLIKPNNPNQAAFVQSGLLFIICIGLSLILSFLLFIKK